MRSLCRKSLEIRALRNKVQDTTTTGFWLSPQQKQAWVARDAHAAPRNSLLALRLDGPLDIRRLERALAEVVSRHEILRTVFRRHLGMKMPFQVVLEDCAPSWQTIELSAESSALNALLDEEGRFAFELEQGPQLRASVCVLGTEAFVLVLTVPALL